MGQPLPILASLPSVHQGPCIRALWSLRHPNTVAQWRREREPLWVTANVAVREWGRGVSLTCPEGNFPAL